MQYIESPLLMPPPVRQPNQNGVGILASSQSLLLMPPPLALVQTCLLPLPFGHAVAEAEVVFCHAQVSARPPFLACFLGMQSALFVAEVVLLAFARATESVLVFKSLFDGLEPVATLRAHEAASSTLVFVQLRSLELQVAFVAALHARVRDDIARREATARARETDRFALVLFRVVQHVLVELVSVQHLVAGVAAPRVSLPLTLDAVFCLGIEGSGIFDLSARGAGMARCAAQSPVSR